MNLTGGTEPERVQGLAVTPNLFQLLGVDPALGRHFAEDEAAPAGFEPSVLISHRLWQRSFRGDPDVLGRTVQINERKLTVIGIMPEGFRFPQTHDLWLPLGSVDGTDRSSRSYSGVARLEAGVTLEQAGEILASLSSTLAAAYPESHRQWAFLVRDGRESTLGPQGARLFLLMLGAMTLVLLIACVNVANLLLVRSTGRSTEVGVRSALGASRGRIVRQMLTEALVLAVTGAALGALLASWILEAVVRSIPETESLAYWVEFAVDGEVLLYVAGLAVVTALVFGLVPALQASRIDLTAKMRGPSRGGSRSTGALLDALVGVEVALALVLLLAAGLMMRSFLALGAADPGFRTESLLSARMVLSGDRYDLPAARAVFFQDLADRMGSSPEVSNAAWTGAIPADDGGALVQVSREAGEADEGSLGANAVPVTAGFFQTLGVSLSTGREFTPEEVRDPGSRVVILGRRLADRLWPGQDPLGRTVWMAPDLELRVVGVAPDLQYEEFGEETESSRLQLHLPYGVWPWRTMALMVRSAGPAEDVASVARAAIRDADPTLPLFETMTMDRRLRVTRWGQQIFGLLFAVYGAAALVLAFAGIYGVMAYSVARRRGEIGLRMALGASAGTVLREVAVRGLRITLAGAAAGLVGAILLARALRGLLYGVAETDPWTFAVVTALMVGVAMAAAAIPARRAMRLEPSDALRLE